MEHQAALPDALVPAEPFPLPALRLADAILPAQPASDASDAVHLDAAADAIGPALTVVPYVEKVAALALGVPARDAMALPAR